MSKLRPFKFKSIPRQVIWGGDKIAAFKGEKSGNHQVGESWEISGIDGFESVVTDGEDAGLTLPQLIEKYREELVGDEVYKSYGNTFPLLIKFIDANHDLSIQVHPRGKKDEMWYIIDTAGEAVIRLGFNQDVACEDYESHVKNHTITDVINCYNAKPGDVFFIPSGQIHSIGAGNFLAEIQQASTDTYRIYDYNRIDCNGKKRELHTELAKKELNFNAYQGKCNYEKMPNKEVLLTRSIHFTVSRIVVEDSFTMSTNKPYNFKILICTRGRLVMTDDNGRKTPVHQGETVLIPACAMHMALNGNADCLLATV